MEVKSLQQVRYPIGQFVMPDNITKEQRVVWIEKLKNFPEELRAVVKNMSKEELKATYREGSWTVAQLVHHITDVNMNFFIRFKLGLTEDHPTIAPFDENKWAQTVDAVAEIDSSLAIVDGLHRRWSMLLHSLNDADWQRTFTHPQLGESTLEQVIAKVVWHSYHHLGHIKIALNN